LLAANEQLHGMVNDLLQNGVPIGQITASGMAATGGQNQSQGTKMHTSLGDMRPPEVLVGPDGQFDKGRSHKFKTDLLEGYDKDGHAGIKEYK
jgi:hypothetical protein